MTTTPYAELLKHPKWQEKRLRILEGAGFECSECGSCDKTLHVHHGYYERGKKPWEYDEKTLHALCEDCHDLAQRQLTWIHRMVGELNGAQLARAAGYLAGLIMHEYTYASFEVGSLEEAEGMADAWGCDPADSRHPDRWVHPGELLRRFPEGTRINGFRLHELRTGEKLD